MPSHPLRIPAIARRVAIASLSDPEPAKVASPLYDRNEAAAYLKMSPGWLKKATIDGKVRACRIGRRCLYHVDDLNAFLDSVRTGGTGNG